MDDIKHEYAFAIATRINKKTGRRWLITGTAATLRRDAWGKFGDAEQIRLAKKRGCKAVRVTIIPGVLKPMEDTRR